MRTTSTTSVTTRPAAHGRQRGLKKMLRDRERTLQSAMASRAHAVPPAAHGDGLDEGEYAEADIQQHIEVALIHMEGETLQRLRDALTRLEAEEYGFCDDCGEEISERRLQALPFAVRCTACEEVHEQQHALQRRRGSLQGLGLALSGMPQH